MRQAKPVYRGSRARRLVLLGSVLSLILAVAAAGSVRERKFTIGPGATGGGAVSCPNGEVPTGGGFTLKQESGSVDRFRIKSSYPTRGGWKAAAYSFDGAGEGSAIAVCSKDDSLFVRTK